MREALCTRRLADATPRPSPGSPTEHGNADSSHLRPAAHPPSDRYERRHSHVTASATILAAILSVIVPTALVIAVILLSDDEPTNARSRGVVQPRAAGGCYRETGPARSCTQALGTRFM